MCHPIVSWVDILPTVLLGLRSAFKEDLKASPADFLYGGQLRLPNEFYEDNSQQSDSAEFLQKLREHFKILRLVPTAHHTKSKMFKLKNIDTYSHVFLRTDAVREPLQPPYTGPYQVINRITDRLFTIRIKDKDVNVTVDRLKPVFDFNDSNPNITSNNNQTATSTQHQNTSPNVSQHTPLSPSENSTAPTPSTRKISFQDDRDCVTGGGVVVASPSPPLTNKTRDGNSDKRQQRRKQKLVAREIFNTTVVANRPY